MKLSYEALEAEVAELRKELVKTKEENLSLKALLKKALEEIESLKEKLNKNSNNSSKPPSTDQKKNTEDNPRKNRKSRKGINRPFFSKEQIDKSIECTLEKCPNCGSHSIEELSIFDILQQIELPEVKAIITEYIQKKYYCSSCKNLAYANLPEGIPNSSFGPRLMGLLSTLTGVFHLAKREAIQLIKDIYNIDIGLGSISNIEERVTAALDPYYQKIHEFVLENFLTKHFDETTWRNSGKRHYVWIATCEMAAFYKIDRYRNTLAFQKLIKNKNLSDKNYVTDRYSIYNNIGPKHQYCLAHLIRNFRSFSQRDGPDKEVGESLEKLLAKSCSNHNKYSKEKITLTQRNRRLGHARKNIENWLYHGFANGSDKLSNLCEKLIDNFENLWIFKKIQGVDPTNNLAERDLRKLVIWRKKSYGTRSDRGKRFVERIATISQTLRKQEKNVLHFIQQAVLSFYGQKDSGNLELKFFTP